MVKTDLYHQLTNALDTAFRQLELEVSPPVTESLSSLIFNAMTAAGRYYHTPEHALSLTDETGPIQTLAALFHDVVYVQIDQGFAPEIFKIIKPYLQACGDEKEAWCLAGGVSANDLSFHQVKDLFGFEDGHRLLTSGGSNEFLSSLVMAKKLETILPRLALLKVACYIEATIPFRRNKGKPSPFATLADRLRQVSYTYNLRMGEEEIDRTIQGAVLFANLDVKNFYDPNPVNFLESTWCLLPEFNPALRQGLQYTIRDYRQALQAMTEFLSSVTPEDVLHEYKGVPPAPEIHEKLAFVHRNLQLGQAYLEMKLLASAVLEALAEVSGGVVPIGEFIGDISKEIDAQGLDQLIPSPFTGCDIAGDTQPEESLPQLLQSGRKGRVDFTDFRTSTLAVIIYHSASAGKIQAYLKTAGQMFEGKINAEGFLRSLDADLLRRIIEAVVYLIPERRDILIKLIAQEAS